MYGAVCIVSSLGPARYRSYIKSTRFYFVKCRTILKIKIYHKLQKRIPHLWRCGREGSRGAWLALREQGLQRSPRVASLPTFLAKQESRAPGRGLFAAAIRTMLRFCFWATDCHVASLLAMTQNSGKWLKRRICKQYFCFRAVYDKIKKNQQGGGLWRSL